MILSSTVVKSRFFYISILIFFLGSNLHAQRVITTGNYLATANLERSLLSKDQEINYLQNTPHKIPLIDDMEMRIEYDEMRFDEQEYLLRARPSGREERRMYKHFHQSNIALQSAEKSVLFKELLMDRYFQLARYFQLKKELGLLEEEQLILEDRLLVLQKMAAISADLDLRDLIDAEDDLHRLQLNIFKLKGRIDLFEKDIQKVLRSTDPIELDTTNFIDIFDIKSLIESNFKTYDSNPSLARRQARIDQTIAEYNLEEAQTEKVIDFFQFRYAQGRKRPLGREFTFGVGIKLPIKGSNQLDLNELELQQIERENDLENLRLNLSQELAETHAQLVQLFEQYDLANQQLQSSQASFSMDNLNQLGSKRPITLLQIKQRIIRRQRALQEIEYDIFLSYLDLIDLSGKATEQPFLNYLDKNLSPF